MCNKSYTILKLTFVLSTKRPSCINIFTGTGHNCKKTSLLEESILNEDTITQKKIVLGHQIKLS